ncbi:MAG: SMC family ATPase, partial [Chloroflexi bacterium]|nr:SMC family ATPase [Chloroflexota bacterium]
MQIESISLSNFKSYAQADIAFQPGVNALIGPNGAGKSTILEAIGFALFNCRGAGHEHRLREGAARGQVTIRFRSSLDDRVYQVERTFNQITTLRYRILDPEINQLVAEGNEDVQTWLARHLRVEPGADLASLFENTIGVPQGTFTAPFLLTAALRKGVFDPLLQVEEYQRTAEKLLATGRLLAKQTADLQAAVAHLEGLLAELPSQQSESKALTRDIDIAQQQIAGSASIINAFKQRIAELDSAEATVRLREGNYNTARLELATVQQELHSAERQLAESVEARRLCAEAQADHVKYTQYDAEYRAQTDQRRERDQLREKLNMNTAESAGLVTRQQLMGRELNELQASKNKMRALEPAVARQAKLEQKLLELEQACRELQYAQKQVDSARSELDNSLIQVNKLNQQLTAAKEIERDIAESQTSCETSQDIITGANAELVRVQTEAEGLQMHTQMLSDETIARCPVCKSELTVAHRVELISQNQQELSNLSQQQAYLMGKIKTERIKLQKLESAIKQHQQELRRLPPESALEQAHAQVEKRRETLDTAQSQVENLTYAPQALREHQVLLASLSDPRREYQLLEERAKREPSLRTEAAALQAQIAARDTETAELRLTLERYRDLDVLMLANQQARDALQGNHLLYLTNSRNAEEYEPRERQAGILRGKTDSLLRKLQAMESALDAARGSYSAEEHVRIRQE